MRRSVKKKLWLDRRSRKIQASKRTKRHTQAQTGTKQDDIRAKKDVYTAVAPENFSFINNTDSTARFFMDIVEQMEKKKYKQMFYIDSSKVNTVTTDALIYILAILYNIKLNVVLKYSFKGNLPMNREAQRVYLESGFMNYVRSKRPAMPKTDNKVQILSGHRTEPEIVGKICDFVMERYKEKYTFTFNLYKTLIELMSNTVHHAYNGKSKMSPNWYLYAVDLGNSIQFTFIDTGEGIPNTVKRKMIEKLPYMVDDSKLIHSAFLGESRTETGLYNRGHGLPALYEKILDGGLRHFYVFSGTGCCKSVEEGGKIYLEQKEYLQEVFGTIFQFEIQKEKEEVAC